MKKLFLAVGVTLAAACSSEPKVDSIDQAVCNCDQTPAPCCCNSPIVIDVAGDGIELTSWTDGVVFAMRPGKPPGERAWTHEGSDDAWLVLDRNGDGMINDGSELFGDRTPQPLPPDGLPKNGFAALAEYDSGDRVIDRNDKVFESLRLWQDRNHDGVSQPDELLTLSAVGVAGLSLDYVEDKRADEHGNAFKYRAAVHGTPGSTVGMTAWDVWLAGPVAAPATGKPGESAALVRPEQLWRVACKVRCLLAPLPAGDPRLCWDRSQADHRWEGEGVNHAPDSRRARENATRMAWENAWWRAITGIQAHRYCVDPSETGTGCVPECGAATPVQTCP
jgi:hypothetical protein